MDAHYYCSLAATGAIGGGILVAADRWASQNAKQKEPSNNHSTLIERWRRVVTIAEREFKSGKELGISFAETFTRQPEYIALSQFLSTETLTALAMNDPTPEAVGPLKLMLANDISRAEARVGLGLLSGTASVTKDPEPGLAGRIDCLDQDVAWDLEHYGVDEEMPLKLKVIFALNVTLWNESPAATTVSGFTLCLLWQDGEYQADQLPVQGYSVQRTFPRSEPGEWGYEVRREELVAFPNNIEITITNHTSGWLRFLGRGIPSEAGHSALLRKDVTWKLSALDRKGLSHVIYDGTWNLAPCGSIERDNEFLFA